MQNEKFKIIIQNLKFLILICNFIFYIFNFKLICLAQEINKEEEPLIVNGDTVEYSTETKDFTASGNVVVISKTTRLICDKLTLNSVTKDCQAQGHVRMEDKQGVIEGAALTYNFLTKKGVILDSNFRANPYFGKEEKLTKVSDEEFAVYRGYITTCDYDNPHFCMKSKRINFFPADKVQIRDVMFYAGKIPLLYLPQYTRSLKEPMMKVQVMPGKSRDWGPYFLSAWYYSLTEDLRGRIYLDYRSDLGIAEGVGVNYDTQGQGKGDFKFYYTQERARGFEEGTPAEFQRYLVRLRHKWDIDEKTNAAAEYYKIVDSKRILMGSQYNLLKDYFPREYERDALPLSYILVHHSFNYSCLDFLLQKRVNRWYSQEEKLPEIKYSLPNIQIGESPFYIQQDSSYVNYNYKYAVPSSSEDDTTYNQFSTQNKFSLPTKIAFMSMTPFLSSEEVFSDNKKGTYHRTLQVNLSTGSDLSTKFYRIFNIKTNFLGLDINNIRHIISPTINYSYSKNSTMQASKARFGGGASVGSSSVTLELENKLQTKRSDQSIDLADFKINTSYLINPKTQDKKGSYLSDIVFKMELLPYSWLKVYGDTTYKHSGTRDQVSYNRFTEANYDIDFNFSEERSFGVGQRYARKGGNQVTYNLKWRLNPKWKISLYNRFVEGSATASQKGLREQEYSISRDLHCWEVDINYNVTRGKGESIWIVFRLKAFPELEFDFNRSYHAPKPGSQRYQE
jgi:hypothetical protein